jgi:DNA-binding response OmpR family regulator
MELKLKLKKNILIIDDDPDVLETISIYLTNADKINIIKAINGQEALFKSNNANFDIFIVDLKIPKISGIEFIKELHKKDYKISKMVLVVSGYLGKVETKQLIELGVRNFIAKPFTKEQIITRINKMIA